MSYEEALFILDVYDMDNSERDKRTLKELGYMLGTVWDVDEPEPSERREAPAKKPDTVTFPLVYAVGMSGMNGLKPIMQAVDKQRSRARNIGRPQDSGEYTAREFHDEILPMLNRLRAEREADKARVNQ